MKEKILITGGAGYVGSVLTPKLIKKGYDVRIIDIMWFGSQGLDVVKNKCKIVKGDIRNRTLVEKCLHGIDYVIHLAAVANDPCGDLNPELTKQINYDATKNLVKESKQKGVKRFVNASTSSVYGIKTELEVTEDLSLEPLTIYSKTKAEAEKVIKECNDDDFITVSVRSATVCGYSPRQRLDVIVNILASRAITKREIIVNGGNQFRPNIHIDDITNLYIALISTPKEKIFGEVFNFGDKNYTTMELAQIVKDVIGEDIKITKNPPTKDSRSYRISSEKIRNILKFEPKKTIKDAVIDLKEAFEKGLIPNPESSEYKNVVRMKEIYIT